MNTRTTQGLDSLCPTSDVEHRELIQHASPHLEASKMPFFNTGSFSELKQDSVVCAVCNHDVIFDSTKLSYISINKEYLYMGSLESFEIVYSWQY